MFPIPPTVSLVSGLYQRHYFVSNLSCHILESPRSLYSIEDKGTLETILAGVERAARHQKHLQPLVLALANNLERIRLHSNRDTET